MAMATYLGPLDVAADVLALMLNVRDLMRLRAADPDSFARMMAELVRDRRFAHTANRIVTTRELQWFERCGVPVRLLEFLEKRVIQTDTIIEYYWYRNGRLHRDEDQPAVICANGDKFWYRGGEKHRDGDQPAITRADGSQFWYRAGKLHRDGDRPAVIHADGTRYWYLDGKLHRDNDQPAVLGASGTRYWFWNGV